MGCDLKRGAGKVGRPRRWLRRLMKSSGAALRHRSACGPKGPSGARGTSPVPTDYLHGSLVVWTGSSHHESPSDRVPTMPFPPSLPRPSDVRWLRTPTRGEGGSSRGRVHLRQALLVLGLVLTDPLDAQGDSGFLNGEGRSYCALSYSWDAIDEYRIDGERTELDGEIARESVSLFASYGVTDALDVSFNATYSDHDPESSLGLTGESGFQDLFVNLRWRVYSERAGPGTLSLLLAPGVKTPLSNYDTTTIAALGDGQMDVLARVVAQYRFDAGPFVAVETGYDLRFGDPDNEVPFNLTLGHTFSERLSIAPFYSRVESLGGETLLSLGDGGQGVGQGAGQGGMSIAGVEEDYEAFGVGTYLRLTDTLGLSASYRSTIGGRNTGQGDGFSVGVVVGWGG